MKTIRKYELEITDEQTIKMPIRSKFLHAGDQNNRLVIWCDVDTDTKMTSRTYLVIGTGSPLPEYGIYLATVQMPNGLVWHILEK